MEKEKRIICYDPELKLEAYSFKGVMQKFPNHFHEYYVIGYIESGRRYLSCKNKEYIVEQGDLVLFNPGENHTCEQLDGKSLDYRCFNITKEVMGKVVLEITGEEYLPNFPEPVLFHNELTASIKELHLMIMEGYRDFKKEELFLFIIEQLIKECEKELEKIFIREESPGVKLVYQYLEHNYMNNISLDELSEIAAMSKYSLIRTFIRERGISPYSCLETIRINQAKKLLEMGIAPLEAALQTGFTDQSHFTNFFKKLIGLTPKQYMNIFREGDKQK